MKSEKKRAEGVAASAFSLNRKHLRAQQCECNELFMRSLSFLFYGEGQKLMGAGEKL